MFALLTPFVHQQLALSGLNIPLILIRMASLTSAAAAHVFRRLSSPPVVRSLAVRQFVSSSARCASRVRPRSRGVVWEQPTRLFERNKLRKERKWEERSGKKRL